MSALEQAPEGRYNAAIDLVGRNLRVRGAKTAVIDAVGRYSYSDIADRMQRAGAALLATGLEPGDRLAICVLDSADFVTTFLGAISVGLIPIALNTLFTADDYAYVLVDSGARGAIVSPELNTVLAEAVAMAQVDIEPIATRASPGASRNLADLMERSGPCPVHWADPQDIAFWLYSSGSTGRPKGAPHRHASPALIADLFGIGTFGLKADDVVFSAAKLFFAYGLGNSLFFPFAAGATTVLHPGRVTADVVSALVKQHGVTIFCGVPTLYSSILASRTLPERGASSLRLCLSAGEALPQEIGQAWADQTGTEIVDGIGSTEMLHIFVSNRPGQARYGVTGWPVRGYDVKLLDEHGSDVAPGGLGELYVRGPTMTPYYWNNPAKTADTFIDGWMKTGDKFRLNEDGSLSHLGRADDMLKVSGIWVSPAEVENMLLTHEAVQEAAVIGVADGAGLMKTKAFVVLKPGHVPEEDLARILQDYAKNRLAPYKYPRLVEFVDSLPKTATGKIRRNVLREAESAASRSTES